MLSWLSRQCHLAFFILAVVLWILAYSAFFLIALVYMSQVVLDLVRRSIGAGPLARLALTAV